MRQVGIITVAGQYVGVITIDRGGPVASFVPEIGFDGHGISERGGRVGGGDHRHGRPHSGASHQAGHLGGNRHGPGHYARGEERARQHPTEGKSNATGDVPYSSSGNPFDRERFAKELEAKPWLREKMKHISLGENQDPRANLAVQETMMNRAITRGTSLEAQVKRHRSSGVDEGGYYAGWAPNYSAEKAAMFDRNLGAVLKGSNISNYATDNSSGDLAARERSTGAFKHHTTINGESFFSPGSAEPQLRERWQGLNRRAQEHESAQAVAVPPMPSSTIAPLADLKGPGAPKEKTGGVPLPEPSPIRVPGAEHYSDLRRSGDIEDRRNEIPRGYTTQDLNENKVDNLSGAIDTNKRAIEAETRRPNILARQLGAKDIPKSKTDEELAKDGDF